MNKKIIIWFVSLILVALITPSLIALLGIMLSPILSTIGFIMLVFIITVIIAWKNKINR